MDLEKTTKDVMQKAITNYAKEYSVEEKDAQLMIKAGDENCTPKYQVLVHNKVKKDVTFNEILNVKIDFLGREMIVSPFISSSLRKLRREHNCSYEDINVLIYTKENTNHPNMYFFEGTKPIKPLSFEYIFGEIK